MKNMSKVMASLAIGALFVYLAFKNVDAGRVMAIISGVDLRFVALSLAVYVFTQAMRAERWRIMLNASAGREYDFFGVFRIFWIGVFANYVLPARLGEFSRPALMKKVYGASFSKVLGVIVVERLFDLLGQVLLFVLVSLFMPLPGYIRSAGFAIAGIVIVLSAGLAAFRSNASLGERLIVRLLSRFPALAEKTVRMMHSFMEGTRVVGTPSRFIRVLAYTMASWLISSVIILFAVRSMGIALPAPEWLSASLMQVIISLALVIPPPPGFIGTFHYFSKQALEFFGVASDVALSFAVLFHGIQLLIVAAVGAGFLVSIGAGLSALTGGTQEETEERELVKS